MSVRDLIEQLDACIAHRRGGRTSSEDLATADMFERCKSEMQRLQKIIDSRPAINAGLPETYIKWSQSIYTMEAAQVLGINRN
jgi:hypothetical protein